MIELSARAVEVIARAEAAARRFDPAAHIRVLRHDQGIAFELADRPADGDAILEHPAGFTVFVQAGLAGTVDVEEPHNRLLLRQDPGAASAPSSSSSGPNDGALGPHG